MICNESWPTHTAAAEPVMPQRTGCRMAHPPGVHAVQILDASWAPHGRLMGALDALSTPDLTNPQAGSSATALSPRTTRETDISEGVR